MAKVDFNTIMTKMANVFKKDLYIFGSTYCLGGELSELENKTQMLVLLNKESSDIIKELFPNEEIIYIKDVKKVKTEFLDNTSTTVDILEKKRVESLVIELNNQFHNIENWETFNFSESDIKTIFDDKLCFELFSDSDIPSVTIGKEFFPLVTGKNIDKLYYSVIISDTEDELNILYTSIDTEFFQLFNIIQYIN